MQSPFTPRGLRKGVELLGEMQDRFPGQTQRQSGNDGDGSQAEVPGCEERQNDMADVETSETKCDKSELAPVLEKEAPQH